MRHFSVILVSSLFLWYGSVCYAVPTKADIEEGTPIRLKLGEAISTKESAAGQKLQLTVVEDVLAKDGKTIVFKEGSTAIGYLMNVDDADQGKGGKLSIEVSSVKAVDGTKVPVRCVKAKSGKGGAGVGSYLAGGVLLGVVGIGLVALCGHGKNAKMPAGTILTAFVDRDSSVLVDTPDEKQARTVSTQISAQRIAPQ